MARFIEFLDEVDALVQEYLMFRGFTSTFSAYQKDLRKDHTNKFNVHCVVEKVLHSVKTHDYRALMDVWNFLNFRFFSNLDGDFVPVVKRIEISLKRFFIVTAVAKGGKEQTETVLAFLKEECQGKSDAEDVQWRPWFSLPFVEHPENDPQFGTYFRAKWEDFFVSSFRNFLTTIFQNIPLPKLLAFKLARQEVDGLRRRIRGYQAEKSRLECKLTQVELQLDMARQRNKMLSLYRVDKLPQDQGVPLATVHRDSASDISVPKSEGAATSLPAQRAPEPLEDVGVTAAVNHDEEPLLLGSDSDDEAPLVLDDDDDSDGGADDLDNTKPLPLGGDEAPLPLGVRRQSGAPPPANTAFDEDDGDNASHQALDSSHTDAGTPAYQSHSQPQSANGSRASRADVSNPPACPFEVVSKVDIHGHSDKVTKCSFSSDGTYFASGSHDSTLRIWSLGEDPAIRRASRVKTFCCTGRILSLDWINDQSLLFGTSQNELRCVAIKDAEGGIGGGGSSSPDGTKSTTIKTDAEFSRVLDVKYQPRSANICVTALGTHGATAAREGTFNVTPIGPSSTANTGGLGSTSQLVIWDFNTSKRLHSMDLGPVPAPIRSLAFNHNGGILIAGDAEGMLRFFDMRGYTTFQAKNITNAGLLAVRFCPDFNSILTLSASGRLQQWSTKMFGTCVQEWQVHGGAAAFQGMPVADLSFANDDRYIVTSSPDASIPLYNLYDSSAPPTVLPALKSGNVVCVDWHSRIPRLVSGSDKTIRVWNLAKSTAASSEGTNGD